MKIECQLTFCISKVKNHKWHQIKSNSKQWIISQTQIDVLCKATSLANLKKEKRSSGIWVPRRVSWYHNIGFGSPPVSQLLPFRNHRNRTFFEHFLNFFNYWRSSLNYWNDTPEIHFCITIPVMSTMEFHWP